MFLDFFKKNQNLEPGFQIFQIPVPKYVFWSLGTFWGVQKIIDVFTIFLIFYKFGLIRDKSSSYIPYRQYGISRFS